MNETDTTFLFLLLGMTFVMVIPRVAPFLMLTGRHIPPFFVTWLSFVPVSILAALLAPELLLKNNALDLSQDNLFLLAAIPTFFIAWKTENLMLALCVGMGGLALMRAFL